MSIDTTNDEELRKELLKFLRRVNADAENFEHEKRQVEYLERLGYRVKPKRVRR